MAETPQEQALKAIYSSKCRPPSIILNGPPRSGKSQTITQFLNTNNEPYSYIKCSLCVTPRILLQRSLKQIFKQTQIADISDAQCENLEAFCSLLSGLKTPHTLVLHGIDQLPSYRSYVDLMTGFCNLKTYSNFPSTLTVILITSTSDPRRLSTQLATPRIAFERLNSERIKSRVLPILVGNETNEYKNDFLDILIQTLSPTNLDVAYISKTASRIWPQFINNKISDNEQASKTFIRCSYLFQQSSLVNQLEVMATPLPKTASLLLCAAYLASYNPPRYDMRCFSLLKNVRDKRRETYPKKQSVIPTRSLAPPHFELERLLAIFHAICDSPFGMLPQVDLYQELANLQAHNLISTSSLDVLDSRTKWRVNVSWSMVQTLAHQVQFPIIEFLAE